MVDSTCECNAATFWNTTGKKAPNPTEPKQKPATTDRLLLFCRIETGGVRARLQIALKNHFFMP